MDTSVGRMFWRSSFQQSTSGFQVSRSNSALATGNTAREVPLEGDDTDLSSCHGHHLRTTLMSQTILASGGLTQNVSAGGWLQLQKERAKNYVRL
jgi:hypothetical protein